MVSRSEIKEECGMPIRKFFRYHSCGSVAYKLGLIAGRSNLFKHQPKNEWDACAGN